MQKYHLIFFFNRFFLFGRCSTKRAALRKEPHNILQRQRQAAQTLHFKFDLYICELNFNSSLLDKTMNPQFNFFFRSFFIFVIIIIISITILTVKLIVLTCYALRFHLEFDLWAIPQYCAAIWLTKLSCGWSNEVK